MLFDGDLEAIYKSNLWLRTAIRVLVPILEFDARDEQGLYSGVQQVNWSRYVRIDQTFSIDSLVNSQLFSHSHYVSLKAKDAIVDQFRRRTGKRPSIDTKRPDLRIHLYVNDQHVASCWIVQAKLYTGGVSTGRQASTAQ